MVYQSEKELLDMIEKCLIENGCETWREEIPDACRNWEKPYRVDLIFYREDIGFVGVEGKNTRSMRQGGVIADAINQINNQYKNQTYFNGKNISHWCIVIPRETAWIDDKVEHIVTTEVFIFLQNFLGKMFNINILEYTPEQKWRKARIKINNNSQKSISIGGDSKW